MNEIARQALADRQHRKGARYHSPLPAELAPFYCYPRDSGHSIMAVPASLPPTAENLMPMPVLTVLRHGWIMQNSLLIVPVLYDRAQDAILVASDEEEAEYAWEEEWYD